MVVSNYLLLEEPIRMASILEPSKPSFFPAMTKIVGTLGPNSRSVEVISGCLKAGMSGGWAGERGRVRLKSRCLSCCLHWQCADACGGNGVGWVGWGVVCIGSVIGFSIARFDFSFGDAKFHQDTLENLSMAIKATQKLCGVMLDTLGPELLLVNKSEHPIALKEDSFVILTPDQDKQASSDLLPINFSGLSKAVKKGDDIFIGQYLFTGNETTSVWMEVSEVKGEDVVCLIKNSATLAGPLYTLHAREFLSGLGDLSQTQIFAKIENVEGLDNFDEILQEADGIILARGNLGIDLPPEKVFLYQKEAIYKCNVAGKPAVVTRVVDSMTDNLRPTRAEATDVANAVLDGTDAILLGAETLRGLYPVETISTVGKICAEAEKAYHQDLYFKKAVKHVGEPMSHLESIASSAVRAAIKVKASIIICFTSSGRAARLIAKYRPTMPVLSVVIPRLKTNQLSWTFSGAFEARQSLIVRGLFPMLADPRHPAEFTSSTNESVLKVALDHGKASGVIKPHDRVVVCQKVGDASVVKIIELED
ncbi:hypothetical protein SASPL_125428 [Salvia splendens]|uniref:Pyruvate kinase n=1 Tax=Salvia splendens TaxID=180675 RepID=A0A8X8ZP62_SALSN|nr:hypothetical protein SASPL_125428 [Salvia splendens]